MSNKFYSYEVSYLMENSISPSLNILLEEEEEKKDEEKKDDFGDEDLFSDKGDSSEESEDDSPEAEGSEDVEVNSKDDADSAKEKGLLDIATNLENMVDYYSSVTSSGQDLFQIQNFLNNDIAAKTQVNTGKDFDEESGQPKLENYSLKRKNSISYFLNEKTDVKRIENDIEAVNNIIDKGTELIDKFKRGTKINIPQYVESSINAFRNFDNLFSKEIIIKQAAINLIVLNSGAKAEENIREFEELFHEELHKQFGIEYEEHAVITKPHNVATGAVKQG